MDWYASLYRLCADPAVHIDEVVVGKQHIRPLPYPEQKIWPPTRRGGGGRGGRRGLGRGRGGRAAGRARGGRGAPALGDGDFLAPDAVADDDGEEGGDEGSASAGDDAVDSADELDMGMSDESDDSMDAWLVDKELEAPINKNEKTKPICSNRVCARLCARVRRHTGLV